MAEKLNRVDDSLTEIKKEKAEKWLSSFFYNNFDGGDNILPLDIKRGKSFL